MAHEHLEAAAEWFARLRDGQVDEKVRREWRLWLKENADHEAAWNFVASIGERFALLRAEGQARAASAVLKDRREPRSTRRKVLTGLTGAAGLGVLGWTGVRMTPMPEMVTAWTADERTEIGEIRELALADGVQLWLGTASAINHIARRGTNLVELVQGEIFIATHGSVIPPLQVTTDHGRMQPLGTEFAVRRQTDATLLSVFEGAVEVSPTDSTEGKRIHAGEQVAFTATGIAAVEPADPARKAWTRGVLLALDIRLDELVRELSRYQFGHLGVAPEVAGLRVLGSYPLRDPDAALAMLADVLPIRINRPLPWWTTIAPAP
ncbi:MAG: FecR domain-containing protein [Pseudomonadota bacterium]